MAFLPFVSHSGVRRLPAKAIFTSIALHLVLSHVAAAGTTGGDAFHSGRGDERLHHLAKRLRLCHRNSFRQHALSLDDRAASVNR
jgi:hypothetical protein